MKRKRDTLQLLILFSFFPTNSPLSLFFFLSFSLSLFNVPSPLAMVFPLTFFTYTLLASSSISLSPSLHSEMVVAPSTHASATFFTTPKSQREETSCENGLLGGKREREREKEEREKREKREKREEKKRKWRKSLHQGQSSTHAVDVKREGKKDRTYRRGEGRARFISTLYTCTFTTFLPRPHHPTSNSFFFSFLAPLSLDVSLFFFFFNIHLHTLLSPSTSSLSISSTHCWPCRWQACTW